MIPDIAALHPQVVHFVIALLFVGVIFRVVSLTGRLKFTHHAAFTLILIGTIASFVAVKSGDEAHGPVERIPGARDVVVEHEEWGERTRNIFVIVTLLEIGALILTGTGRRGIGKGLAVGSAVVGLAGLFALYETAEHGGEVVYAYGGGPGVRSGDPEHIENLYVAGLYHQAMQARKDNRPEEAARLIGELSRVRPDEPNATYLRIESMLRDQQDARGALNALAALPPTDNTRQKRQRGLIQTDAYAALGMRDSARAAIDALLREEPDNARLKAKADSLR